MALIVLMEDDAATRVLVNSVLRKDGHSVLAADNGTHGLLLVRAQRPDLVISDIQMPQMDGFEMLAQLRADPALATLPVILLTSLQERAHMRLGMTSGADDYITKPFRPGELREAVEAQLNRRETRQRLRELEIDRAVTQALDLQRDEIARRYERRLAAELSSRWPTGDGAEVDSHFPSATVLFADLAHQAALAERLPPEVLTQVIRRFYEAVSDAAHLFHTRYLQFVGSGLLAVFTDGDDTRTVNHGLRAVRTALALAESALAMPRLMPDLSEGPFPFAVHTALHTGPVTMANLRDGLHGALHTLPVGDTVSTTVLLQRQGASLDWPVLASVATLRCVTGAVRAGRRALVTLPGRSQPVDAAEVLGSQSVDGAP